MEAIILAGGKGKRLRSAVSDRPKPLADIDGRPFLHYLMSAMIKNGVSRFILAVGYMRNMIIDSVGNQFEGVPVIYSIEDEPLGTGGGISKALPKLENDKAFLVANGDSVFRINYEDFIANHKTVSSDLSIAMLQAPESDRYGSIVRDTTLRVTAMPSGRAVKGSPCNGGVYLINRYILEKHNPGLKHFLLKTNGCLIY